MNDEINNEAYKKAIDIYTMLELCIDEIITVEQLNENYNSQLINLCENNSNQN